VCQCFRRPTASTLRFKVRTEGKWVFYIVIGSLGAGVAQSVVSGYGLDDRAIEVQSTAEAKDFSSNL
jgi:hypothetical protein